MKTPDFIQRPFNSSLAYLERVERRWEDCDTGKIEGEIIKYFRSLEVIYRNTHPFFNEEEQGNAEELIKKCENSLGSVAKVGQQQTGVILTSAENSCDELRMMLVALLFKYKITYYRSEVKKYDEEIEEDFH